MGKTYNFWHTFATRGPVAKLHANPGKTDCIARQNVSWFTIHLASKLDVVYHPQYIELYSVERTFLAIKQRSNQYYILGARYRHLAVHRGTQEIKEQNRLGTRKVKPSCHDILCITVLRSEPIVKSEPLLFRESMVDQRGDPRKCS